MGIGWERGSWEEGGGVGRGSLGAWELGSWGEGTMVGYSALSCISCFIYFFY